MLWLAIRNGRVSLLGSEEAVHINNSRRHTQSGVTDKMTIC